MLPHLPGRWADRGACRGRHDLFLPPNAERPDARRYREALAVLVCRTCPVLAECHAHVVEHGEVLGVWAAMTEDELLTLRRR
jgi:WhiB family redox-sensing transcriptional regulator